MNLLAFNLVPAGGKIYFNAFDAGSRSLVGAASGETVVSRVLPTGFLNQGGGLAVKPDETGVTLSKALSALQAFEKGLVLTSPSVVTLPGKPTAVGIAPWDGIYVGTTTPAGSPALGAVQPDGSVNPVATLTGAATVMTPCGNSLVIGGVKLLARAKLNENGTVGLDLIPTPVDVFGLSCWQDESVLFVGQNRTLGVLSRTGSVQTYAVPGSGDVVEVATGPTSFPSALLLNVLNSRGSLILAQVPYSPPNDRNSSGCRLPGSQVRVVSR